MRIVYDGAIFSMQHVGGISRYFTALLNQIPEDTQAMLLTSRDQISRWLNVKRLQTVEASGAPWPKMLRAVQRIAERSRVHRCDAAADADLMHWSYYTGLHRRPVSCHRLRKNVVTVYDLIHELFPETDRRGREVAWKRHAIEHADLILCISETTRQDLISHYPHVADRTITTLLGNSLEGVVATQIPVELRHRPFVLFVGGRGGYKNFGVLAAAWKKARRQIPDLLLAVVGGAMSDAEIDRWGLSNDREGLRVLKFVDDGQLAALYQASAAFVFPSRYEGFGLPAIEAMSCGTLLLTSGGGSLREVVGDGGILFDADAMGTLAELLVAAIETPGSFLSLREQGRRWASQFTWNRTAESTFGAYRKLLGLSTSHGEVRAA